MTIPPRERQHDRVAHGGIDDEGSLDILGPNFHSGWQDNEILRPSFKLQVTSRVDRGKIASLIPPGPEYLGRQ